MGFFLRLLFAFLFVNSFTLLAWGQAEPDSAQAEPAVNKKVANLLVILESVKQLELELKARQLELGSQGAQGREDELTKQVQDIVFKLTSLQRNFDQLAAEVDPSFFEKQEVEREVQLSRELKDLLSPVINEVKRLTSRPREIDHLRTQISDYNEQLNLVAKALTNIENLIPQTQNADLVARLNQAASSWGSHRQEIKTQLSIASQKLSQRLSEKKSLSESLEGIFQIFFKSRGRNLLLALLTTFLFWLMLRRLQVRIRKTQAFKQRVHSFSIRLFNILYAVFTIVGAILVFMIMLYFFGDWVLLILVLMLLIGLVWASKQALPRFWTQATLLLNMGTVREGERVIYQGLPWRVDALNFYSHLRNPALAGGVVRLPIQDIAELRSRMYQAEEPWFPTNNGDWVLLADETYGQVVLQSVESVQVKLKGGSVKTYSAQDFLAQSPNVLSRGFRITVSFGIDYQHQALVTTEIVAELQDRVSKDLLAFNYNIQDFSINVEFEQAAASSLNLAVLADFSGSLAHDYQSLERSIQKICVDCCNDQGWIIPFGQLTVHMAGGGE